MKMKVPAGRSSEHLSAYFSRCISLNESLVPRPHPLMRRNGLVNQVEFLGLVYTFATVSPSNIQNILRQTCKNRYGYLSRDNNVVREVLCSNYQSCNLIGPYHFWGICPRNLTSLTRTVSYREIPAGWARD